MAHSKRAWIRRATGARSLCCVAVLLWGPAVAAAEGDVPGGMVYLGVGVSPMFSSAASGVSLSLEGQLELGRFFAGGTILSGPAQDNKRIAFFGPRLGLVLTDNATVAPYVSLAFGQFAQGQILDDAPTSPAFMPELGVTFLRGNRWGRVTVSVVALLLTSHAFVGRRDDRLDDWYGLTMRFML